MDTQTRIIVSILAATDAVFAPLRDFRGRASANIAAAREAFSKAGVPWGSGGKSPVAQRNANRALERLVTRGLAVVAKGRVKTTEGRLSDAGETLARAAAGLPGLIAGWESLKRVAELSDPPAKAKLLTDVYVAEPRLAGIAWGAVGAEREFRLVEDLALPALVRGWLGSRADSYRHVYYTVLPAGYAALAAGVAPPAEPETEPDLDARALYLDHFQRTRTQLLTAADGAARDIGPIPLPAAIEAVEFTGV